MRKLMLALALISGIGQSNSSVVDDVLRQVKPVIHSDQLTGETTYQFDLNRVNLGQYIASNSIELTFVESRQFVDPNTVLDKKESFRIKALNGTELSSRQNNNIKIFELACQDNSCNAVLFIERINSNEIKSWISCDHFDRNGSGKTIQKCVDSLREKLGDSIVIVAKNIGRVIGLERK